MYPTTEYTVYSIYDTGSLMYDIRSGEGRRQPPVHAPLVTADGNCRATCIVPTLTIYNHKDKYNDNDNDDDNDNL